MRFTLRPIKSLSYGWMRFRLSDVVIGTYRDLFAFF